MVFINYVCPRFSNWSREQEDMYEAPSIADIISVRVTNKSTENLRINLVIIDKDDAQNYIIEGKIITPNGSENILADGRIKERLVKGDKLQCYSNGYSQVFDCSFNIEELKETI